MNKIWHTVAQSCRDFFDNFWFKE